MKAWEVTIEQRVRIELDDTKFTEGYLEDYRKTFYPFQTIRAHVEHLGQLVARGLVGGWNPEEFIEGYGKASEIGLSAKVVETEVQDVEEVALAGDPQ